MNKKILFRICDNGSILYDLTIDEFLKLHPPCKECLVQATCLKENNNDRNPVINIRVCPKLNEFVVMSDFVELQLRIKENNK